MSDGFARFPPSRSWSTALATESAGTRISASTCIAGPLVDRRLADVALQLAMIGGDRLHRGVRLPSALGDAMEHAARTPRR